MLAQAETKSKVPFGSSNGRPDKSNGLDQQFAKLKKELTLAQREISDLKNQLHKAKENIAKERAERGSKSKKDDSPDEEVGSKSNPFPKPVENVALNSGRPHRFGLV